MPIAGEGFFCLTLNNEANQRIPHVGLLCDFEGEEYLHLSQPKITQKMKDLNMENSKQIVAIVQIGVAVYEE
jgi:hypothetical protein